MLVHQKKKKRADRYGPNALQQLQRVCARAHVHPPGKIHLSGSGETPGNRSTMMC